MTNGGKSGRREIESPAVLLECPRHGRLELFSNPNQIIEAFDASDVPGALAALDAAVAEGCYAAGWFSYELGYALEPKFGAVFAQARKMPLLWFGIFDRAEEISRADLPATDRIYIGPRRLEWDRNDYAQRFRRAKNFIEAGDIYQVNLSFRADFGLVGAPLDLFLALRDRAQAPHAAYIDTGAVQIASLSPELFFEIEKGRRITARPMKGTIARGADEISDAGAKAKLAASAKDRAENLMIVDLLRNDIGRLAKTGSVNVPELFAIETYPTLHTMVSTVTGELKTGTRIQDIVRALFPCGSITGAPKIRAMEIIRELEESARGIYSGAIGFFAPDGSARFNVAIRTITLQEGRGTLGIGGAVVQDSKLDNEYDECLLKARFLDDARRPIGLIETLRWDNGFARLDRHLARMEASARAFALPFEPSRAREALEAAVRSAASPQRVRLTLAEDGRFECSAAPLEPSPAAWSFAISPLRVRSTDVLLRHKTTWRAHFDDQRERLAVEHGADEVLFLNERGELTEGSRSTIFLSRKGVLLTPALSCGLLDGVLRREMLENGDCIEAILTPDDVHTADEIWFGNSLRGLIRGIHIANT